MSTTIVEHLRTRKRLLKVAEVASVLRISRQQVYKLVSSVRIPYIKIGSSLRFDPSMLADWLASEQGYCFGPRRNPVKIVKPRRRSKYL